LISRTCTWGFLKLELLDPVHANHTSFPVRRVTPSTALPGKPNESQFFPSGAIEEIVLFGQLLIATSRQKY